MDAERRGVFLEIGAIFRFRHNRVQLALKDWYRANQIHGPEDLTPRLLQLLADLSLYENPPARNLTLLSGRVHSYHELAKRNLAEFGHPLLTALNQQADTLAALRSRDEEITIRAEITATAREMVASGCTALPTLAESLERFALCLAEAGRAYEAFGVMAEAADVFSQSAATERHKFQQRLADWIELFPYGVGTRTRTRDLIAATDAMADIYRDLVLTEGDATPAGNAASLIRLAHVYRHQYRDGDAADALKRAAQVYRESIRASAADPEPARAEELLSIAPLLESADLADEAITALTDAVGVYRTLADTQPDQAAAHRACLARSLVLLADLLGRLGRPGELNAIHQAFDTYRAAAQDGNAEATAASPPLADLGRLAIRLWKLCETDAALDAAQTVRRLVKIHAADDDPALAEQNLPPQDAAAKIRALMRRASRHPGGTWVSASGRVHSPRVQSPADELDTMAFHLLVAGRVAESRAASEAAVHAIEAAVMMYRVRAADTPAESLPSLAGSLDELAAHLRKVGSRETEAAVVAAEARDIRRRLGQ
jgi:hypothetical protein